MGKRPLPPPGIPPIRRLNTIRRNAPCPCGSGQKWKKCCLPAQLAQEAAARAARKRPTPAEINDWIDNELADQLVAAAADRPHLTYIDTGEDAVRWVICDDRGTSFFADKDNRVLVFNSKAEAFAVAAHSTFADQAPGEINVAGVGETKFAHLCDKLPYVEVSAEEALILVRERLAIKSTEGEEGHGDVQQAVGGEGSCGGCCKQEACSRKDGCCKAGVES